MVHQKEHEENQSAADERRYTQIKPKTIKLAADLRRQGRFNRNLKYGLSQKGIWKRKKFIVSPVDQCTSQPVNIFYIRHDLTNLLLFWNAALNR